MYAVPLPVSKVARAPNRFLDLVTGIESTLKHWGSRHLHPGRPMALPCYHEIFHYSVPGFGRGRIGIFYRIHCIFRLSPAVPATQLRRIAYAPDSHAMMRISVPAT